MSVNVAFNVIRAKGPRSHFSTESPDPRAGETELLDVSGTVELSSDESHATYRDFGWTRPGKTYRIKIDGVPVRVCFDRITVTQPSPVTLPVLTNIGRKISTAGLNPTCHLAFSQPELTGSWNINDGEHAGTFHLPAEGLTKSAFGLLSVDRSGSLALGAVADLTHAGEPGKAGGFVRYAYEHKLFRGWAAGGVPIELRLHLVVDRVRVTGQLEKHGGRHPGVVCVESGDRSLTQLQTQQ